MVGPHHPGSQAGPGTQALCPPTLDCPPQQGRLLSCFSGTGQVGQGPCGCGATLGEQSPGVSVSFSMFIFILVEICPGHPRGLAALKMHIGGTGWRPWSKDLCALSHLLPLLGTKQDTQLGRGGAPLDGQGTRSAGQGWKTCDPSAATPHKYVKSATCPAHLPASHGGSMLDRDRNVVLVRM